MDYRKKLNSAAALDRMAPGSRLARVVATGAACDALQAGATLVEFAEAAIAAGALCLVRDHLLALFPRDDEEPVATVYAAAAIVPTDGWELARCA